MTHPDNMGLNPGRNLDLLI